MVKEPEFEFVVELDDNDLEHEVGGTSIPCGTIIIASLTQCFGDTAIWGSCGLKDKKSWSEPDLSALWCEKVWFKVVGGQL